MPIACQHKLMHGGDSCLSYCPSAPGSMVFDYVRVEGPGQEPSWAPEIVDVALLDMNHGWPNLGHDSLVHVVQDATCDIRDALRHAGLSVRLISYDVRRRGGLPDAPGARFALYLGTGGPGHLDPRQNDGERDGSQGITEDPSWEAPLFKLWDDIMASEHGSMLAVCHTFGVMCRWSGVAEAKLRGDDKGGKSSGIMENVLTLQGLSHPWFGQFAKSLPANWRLPIVDNRLYDLIPQGPIPFTPIGYETLGIAGPPGDALTMLEWARDSAGVMPRVFGVNHHPEIVDRARQLMILQQKRDRGEVSHEWYQERLDIMTETYPDDAGGKKLHLTSDFTLIGPLRFQLYRHVRRRAEMLGRKVDVHEDRLAPEGNLSAPVLAASGGPV